MPDDIPVFDIEIKAGEKVYLPRVMKEAGLAKSNSEAKRLIKQGAVSIDGKKVGGEEVDLPSTDVILKVGKRRFARIRCH